MTVTPGMLTSDFLDELKIEIKNQNQNGIKHKFGFLSDHFGLQAGCLHGLVASSGAGKSSVVLSIVLDALELNPLAKVLVWLSEERTEDILCKIAEANFRNDGALSRLFLYSEVDSGNAASSQSECFMALNESILEHKPDIVIFDNLTTSMVYEGNYADQYNACRMFKKIAINNNVALLYIAHTKKGVGGGHNFLIDQDDIKGPSTIVNLSEYFYIIQKLVIGERWFNFVMVTKSRKTGIKNSFYLLDFNKENGLYDNAIAVDFDVFKEKFNMRNRL